MNGVRRRPFPPRLFPARGAERSSVEEELRPLRLVPGQGNVVPGAGLQPWQAGRVVPAMAVVKGEDHRPEDRLLPFHRGQVGPVAALLRLDKENALHVERPRPLRDPAPAGQRASAGLKVLLGGVDQLPLGPDLRCLAELAGNELDVRADPRFGPTDGPLGFQAGVEAGTECLGVSEAGGKEQQTYSERETERWFHGEFSIGLARAWLLNWAGNPFITARAR